MTPLMRMACTILAVLIGAEAGLSGLCRAEESKPAIELGERYTDRRGGFSLCLPQGWRPQPAAGGASPVFVGPGAELFHPYVSLGVEESDLPFAEYANERKEELKKDSNKTDVFQAALPTASGALGTKLSYDQAIGTLKLHVAFYLFSCAAGRHIVIALFCLNSDAPRLELSIDAAAKTLRLEQALPTGTLDANGRWCEQQGGYSFVPPKDWKLRHKPGSYYKQLVGPRGKSNLLSISFSDRKDNQPLKDYVAREFAALVPADKSLQPILQATFTTESLESGLKTVYDRFEPYAGQRLHEIDYNFALVPGKKTRIHCTCPVAEAALYDSVFDDFVKTFRAERVEKETQP